MTRDLVTIGKKKVVYWIGAETIEWFYAEDLNEIPLNMEGIECGTTWVPESLNHVEVDALIKRIFNELKGHMALDKPAKTEP